MKPRKYKALRGAVRSYTGGFTGLVSSGFPELARFAMTHRQSNYRFDILTQASVPDISDNPWYSWLVRHIEPVEWLEQVGCSVEYVMSFVLSIEFNLGGVQNRRNEYAVPFASVTTIKDDRGMEYVYKDRGFAWVRKSPQDGTHAGEPELLAVPPLETTVMP